jgi:choline kinase
MQVIILAAGNSVQMSGTIKCLIKNPVTKKTILQHLLDAFHDCEPIIVVGYRGVEIMQEYPHLEYVLNSNWNVTAPSYSVGLALADSPCYIVPGDILLDRNLVEYLHRAPENSVLTRKLENRSEQSTNFVVENGVIKEAYVGSLRNSEDPEGIGIIKLTNPQLLQEMKKNCLKHGNLHIGLNLVYSNNMAPIYNVDLADYELNEFNTYLDYANYLKICKGKLP